MSGSGKSSVSGYRVSVSDLLVSSVSIFALSLSVIWESGLSGPGMSVSGEF